jgi:hypothetical protein
MTTELTDDGLATCIVCDNDVPVYAAEQHETRLGPIWVCAPCCCECPCPYCGDSLARPAPDGCAHILSA